MIDTPDCKNIDNLEKLLSVDKKNILKTIIYKSDDELIGCVIRADYSLNETKIRNYLNSTNLTLASDKDLIDKNLIPGYISPINIDNIRFIFDDSVKLGPNNFIVGANIFEKHYKGLSVNRDLNINEILDIAEAEEGHQSKDGSKLIAKRGIEVGHVFKLGDSYTSKMGAKFSDKDGKYKDILMGCYGIGVGRLLAACIEANKSDNAMNLPISISPFSIYLMALQTKDEDVMKVSDQIFQKLSSIGFDLLFDDRDIQTGVKFNDSDLLSLPFRIVVSKRNLDNGVLELYDRDNDETLTLTQDQILKFFKNIKF